jgi:hypothetical protein
MRDRWVVVIWWDDEGDHTSPPIGPFTSQGDARRFATLARKRLQANGRKAHGRVKTSLMVHPERALAWEGLGRDRET